MNKILLFLAFMFLGMGIGMLFDHTSAGTILGMGIGLLFIALVPSTPSSRHERTVTRKIINSGRLFLGIIGIGFILWGLEMLGIIVIPGTFWQHLGAFILILIGVGFLYAAIS